MTTVPPRFGTLEDFAEWLKTKPSQETFYYLSPFRCPGTQYASDRLEEVNVDFTCAGDGMVFVFNENAESVIYPGAQIDTKLFHCASEVYNCKGHRPTFGDLLERVKDEIKSVKDETRRRRK